MLQPFAINFLLLFSALAGLCWAAEPSTTAYLRAPNDNTTTTTILYTPAPLNNSGHFTYFLHTRRRLTYFILDDKAIIDMDQVYGSTLDILNSRMSSRRSDYTAAAVALQPQVDRRALSFRNDDERRWAGGVVQYYWFSDASKTQRSSQFAQAVQIWQAMLPWLRFEEQGVSQITWGNGPIVIKAISGNNSASTVGRNPLPDGNFLLLGEAESLRVYVHQIGHVLGLLHEHQRPDRPEYFDLYCDRLLCQPQYDSTGQQTGCLAANCGNGSCTGYGCDYVTYPESYPSLNFSGSYDTKSIMQIDPASLRNPNATGDPLVPRAPHTYEPPATCFPSVGDAQRVCALYWESCTGVCGNGVLEEGEECDDGNNVGGDGCSPDCKKEGGGDDGGNNGGNGGNGTCFDTCNPQAGLNLCDVTTSCTWIVGGKSDHEYYCACRDGFKTTTNSTAVQFRLPFSGQETRVFVKPGEVCNTLCEQSGCSDVPMETQCY